MSLIVKCEDVFQWAHTSKMNKQELIEEIDKLRKLIEAHYWETEVEIEELSNQENMLLEIGDFIKQQRKKNRKLVNRANAKKPRKIKQADRDAIIEECRRYLIRNGSTYGLHPHLKEVLKNRNLNWGKKAIDRILREIELK